jgi:hypothetical protein
MVKQIKLGRDLPIFNCSGWPLVLYPQRQYNFQFQLHPVINIWSS